MSFIYNRKDKDLPPMPLYEFDPCREVLLKKSYERYSLFPIRYHDIWESRNNQINKIWFSHDIDFSKDRIDFASLATNVQTLVLKTLSFFANADNLVLENLADEFVNQIQVPESRMAYAASAYMETIHIEVYNLAIDTVVTDEVQKEAIFRAVVNDPIIQPKFHWSEQFLNRDIPFSIRLLIMTFTEGILFSSAFVVFIYLRMVLKKCPGISLGNEAIMIDEGMHVVNNVIHYLHIVQKVPTEIVHAICEDFVQFEIEFASKLLDTDDPISDLSFQDMSNYIKCVANTVLSLLKVPILYPNARNPFQFMETVGLPTKSNFFEKNLIEYENPRSETSKHKPIVNMGFSCDD